MAMHADLCIGTEIEAVLQGMQIEDIVVDS